ncbi:MAG: tetratricopeptide repeat-containing sensor histidine kinase, partial [Bacteroidota bacterium]
LKIHQSENNESGLARTNSDIGYIYLELKKFDLAVHHFNKSLDLRIKLNDLKGQAKLYNNLGEAHKRLGENEKSLEYFADAIETHNQIHGIDGYSKSRLHAMVNMNYLNLELLRYKEVIKDLNHIIPLTHNRKLTLNEKIQLGKAYQILSKAYKAQNNEEAFFEAYQQHIQLEIEIAGDRRAQELQESENRFMLARAEQELELEKKELQNQLQESQLSNQKLMIVVIAVGLLFVFTISLALYYQNRQIKTSNQLLDAKNDLIEKQNKDLVQLNKEKNYLIRTLSHDLKNPLHHILGLLHIIKQDDSTLNDDQQEYMDMIAEETGYINDILEKTLDIEVVESKKVELDLEDVDVEELLYKAIASFQKQASRKSQNIHTAIAKGNYITKLDRSRTRQIVQNLISNAIKFSEAGKSIEVSLEEVRDKIRLTVKDHGPGFQRDELPKIFQRYQTLSAKPTDGESSTGLGLSIIKTYVDAMGGKVWCESEPSQGATFKVEFKLTA